MKSWVKTSALVLIGAALVALVTRAQLNDSPPAPDSVVQLTAETQGLNLVAPVDLPENGTFWVVDINGVLCPNPCPPPNVASLPIYGLADGQFLVDATGGKIATEDQESVADALAALAERVNDLITMVQTYAARQAMRAMGMNVPGPGDGGEGGGEFPNNNVSLVIDTNSLWLEITNVANGWASLNLHNATNQVYEIWSKTELAQTNWNIEQELWPTDPAVMPFTVPTLDRTNLFIWARDWTGIDENGNNIPDWWEWRYFGAVNVTGTDNDYSGSGLTFAEDYANTQAPTVFAFTNLETADNYVSSSSAALQLGVAGTPYYVATLLDDANFSNAVWNTYGGSSMTVNLGSTEGWHEILIGLRGHADDASSAVWQWKRLKLDTTPPLLVVTNPTVSTISIPLIQLQGYSPEALSSISYDLTNAAGVVTNQQVLISDQFYSTNTWEFTTNWFQAFDIALTNGLNRITLHAVDLAGNVTTTNFNFTVNYSGTTNPVINLFWPQNGQQVSGDNFTWRGWVDDPTATVVASITDTNGNTSTVNGLVDRDGNFWAENLPLSSGTNWLKLNVTNAAGKPSMTTILVIQNTVNLTIFTPDQNSLWNPTINVTGYINTNNYTVWVNGVQGTVDTTGNGDGTYNWSVDNVPLDPGGSTTINVMVYPPGHNPPPPSGGGSGGSGGGNGGTGSGNPSDPNATGTELVVDKPARLFVASDAQNLDFHSESLEVDNDDVGEVRTLYTTTRHYDHHLADGAGGAGSSLDNLDNYFDYYWADPPDSETHEHASGQMTWLADRSGTETDSYNGVSGSPRAIAWPVVGNEHCVVNDPKHQQSDSSERELHRTHTETETYTRAAQTKYRLQTGGRAFSHAQGLFQFTAKAAELLDKRAEPPFTWSPDGETHGYSAADIPPQSITLNNVGTLLADANYWKPLPNNVKLDTTAIVKGKDFYSFTIGAQKYELHVKANEVQLDPNMVVDGAKHFCVGQYIPFSPVWSPATPTYVDSVQHWTLPGTYVSEQYEYSPVCTSYHVNADLLTNLTTPSWYVDELKAGKASIGMNLHFSNGQYVSIAADGQFNVYKPKVNWVGYPYSSVAVDTGYDGSGATYLHFGTTYKPDYGVYLTKQIINDGGFSGTYTPTQLRDVSELACGTNGLSLHRTGIGLDVGHGGLGLLTHPDDPNTYVDSPAMNCNDANNYVSVNHDKFRTFLMFQPTGGISVPLKLIEWNWFGFANRTGGWHKTSGDPDVTASDQNTTEFPVWTNIVNGQDGTGFSDFLDNNCQ